MPVAPLILSPLGPGGPYNRTYDDGLATKHSSPTINHNHDYLIVFFDSSNFSKA